MLCKLLTWLRAQTIIALCMFSVGLTTCFVTHVLTFNRLGWLVKDGPREYCKTMWDDNERQFVEHCSTDEFVQKLCSTSEDCTNHTEKEITDLFILYTDPAAGGHFNLTGINGTQVQIFTDVGGCTAKLTFVFVLVMMILGAVQVSRLQRMRLALCGEPGVWASRVTLWISAFLVHVLFFVQVALISVLLILDFLCPKNGLKHEYSVDAKGYCHSSMLRGGLNTSGALAASTGLGYFLLHYAILLMASSLNAEFAVASAASAARVPLLG